MVTVNGELDAGNVYTRSYTLPPRYCIVLHFLMTRNGRFMQLAGHLEEVGTGLPCGSGIHTLLSSAGSVAWSVHMAPEAFEVVRADRDICNGTRTFSRCFESLFRESFDVGSNALL